MSSCGQADGMERKELLLFTRMEPHLSIEVNLNLISVTFYIVLQKNGNLQLSVHRVCRVSAFFLCRRY